MPQTLSPFLTSTRLPAAAGIQAGRLCDFGFVMLGKHQYSQAFERFEAVLDEEPGCVSALFGRAQALQGMGRFALALTDVARAEARLRSPNAQLALVRAELLMVQRKYALASKACQEALALNPALLKAQWLRLKLVLAHGLRENKAVVTQSWSELVADSTMGSTGDFVSGAAVVTVEAR